MSGLHAFLGMHSSILVRFALYLCWSPRGRKAGRGLWHSDETLHPSSQTKHKGGKAHNKTRLLQELQPPGGVERNFLWCQNIANPLAVVCYHITELQLWPSRFLMCDWKCVCVCMCMCVLLLTSHHNRPHRHSLYNESLKLAFMSFCV